MMPVVPTVTVLATILMPRPWYLPLTSEVLLIDCASMVPFTCRVCATMSWDAPPRVTVAPLATFSELNCVIAFAGTS